MTQHDGTLFGLLHWLANHRRILPGQDGIHEGGWFDYDLPTPAWSQDAPADVKAAARHRLELTRLDHILAVEEVEIALKLVAPNTIIRPQKFRLLLVGKTMLLSATTPATTSKY